jgi:hypothetical protein
MSVKPKQAQKGSASAAKTIRINRFAIFAPSAPGEA